MKIFVVPHNNQVLMLLNWVLPSSVVKKNPTATCLFGQFRKINPWLSWALPLADHKHNCIFIVPAEFSDLTKMKHFYHMSFSIWNCKLMSILNTLNTLVSASPAKLQPPNTLGLLLPPLSLLQCFSPVCSSELDSAWALLTSIPLCLGQGETSSHRQWVGLLLVLSSQQVKDKQDKQSVYLR